MVACVEHWMRRLQCIIGLLQSGLIFNI